MEITTLHLRKDDREYIQGIQDMKNLGTADALHVIILRHQWVMEKEALLKRLVELQKIELQNGS